MTMACFGCFGREREGGGGGGEKKKEKRIITFCN
jgi:hypothetical protein